MKSYASAIRFVHEQAYVLAKSEPAMPPNPIADVIAYDHTGNRLNPCKSAFRLWRRSLALFRRQAVPF